MEYVTTPYLAYLVGSEITTDAHPHLSLPAKTWILTQYLGESALLMDKEESDLRGSVSTRAKFLCYEKGDPTHKPAFMRIARQLPYIGTEYTKPTARALQAIPAPPLAELKAFQRLKIMECKVTPALLGYLEGKQESDDAIPGGFSICIVWDKVPGESLSPEYFWSLDRNARDKIREKFRKVYEEFLPYGVHPCIPTSTNLIYDEASGSIHISGFDSASFLDPPEEWDDSMYGLYCLAKAPLIAHGEWEF